MSNTKLVFILIGARRRVGKDTFAAMFCDAIKENGGLVMPKSFAGALKDEVNIALRTQRWHEKIDAWTEDGDIKESVVRPLLIAWGNGRRYLNENHWVDKIVADAERVKKDHLDMHQWAGTPVAPWLFVVVSDWRFPNEIERIRLGLRLCRGSGHCVGIHLSRPDAPEGTPDEIINDPLCQKLSDFQLVNNGDLKGLRELARVTLTNIVNLHLEEPRVFTAQ